MERVLGSSSFRNSESVRKLLAYLGERSLAGCAEGLKEFTIGVEVFNKPANYDPQQDPAVRVLASKLRHKLEDYYLKDGAGDPVRIEIPKGHYRLIFRLPPVQIPPPDYHALAVRLRAWKRTACVLAAGMAAVLTSFAVGFLGPVRHPVGTAEAATTWTPELERIWRPFLRENHPVILSLGTPMFAKFSGGFFRNPRVNDWKEAEESGQVYTIQKMMGSAFAVPSYAYTGVGEAIGAFTLGRLLQPWKPGLILKRSSVLSWDEIGHSSVIFLGAPKFNLHLKELAPEDGFVIQRGAVRNLKPAAGEKDAYRNKWSADHLELLEEHALIQRLPGLHGRGEIMVLSSASTEGTWAAAEYVSQPGYARDLVSRICLPSGELPRSFQAVIKVKFRAQVPTEITYVTHRAAAAADQPAEVVERRR